MINAVLFAAVLWVSASLERLLGIAGWLGAKVWPLYLAAASWPLVAGAAVYTATATWALVASRRDAIIPAWLLEHGQRQAWTITGRGGLAEAVSTGIAVGLTGTGVLVGVLAVAGGASSAAPAEWETLILWVIAAVGATAGLALELSVPRRGVGAGALAGPLACVIAVIGLITYTNLDGRPSIGRGFSAVAPPLGLLGSKPLVRLVTSVGQPPLALWLVLAVLAAPAALLTWRKEQRLRRTWPAAAAMGLVVSLALVTVRGPLVGLASAPNPAVAEAQQYLTTVGPDAARRYDAVGEAVRLIGADTSSDGPARATRIRNEVLIPLRALLADAESYQPATSQTRSVHLALVAALRTAVEKWETVAALFQNGDAAALADAGAKQGEENRFLLTWQQGLRELQATVTKG